MPHINPRTRHLAIGAGTFIQKGGLMDIRYFELLADIAETHNLTASAARMHYTQSGVSHAIKNLEKELGIRLFYRTNRGVEFTPDAQTLLPPIRSMIAQYHRFKDAVDSINGLQGGTVTIGSYSSIAIHWLPDVIKQFQREYPNVTLQIREGNLEHISKWMSSGDVDFGFVSKVPEHEFDFFQFAEDPLYAVVPLDFEPPEHFGGVFPIEAFADYPFITTTALDNDVAAALEKAHVKPPVSFYSEDDHSIIAMVEHGLGISLLPALILEGYDSNLKKIPLKKTVKRKLGIGVTNQESLSVADLKFIDVAKKTLLPKLKSPLENADSI